VVNVLSFPIKIKIYTDTANLASSHTLKFRFASTARRHANWIFRYRNWRQVGFQPITGWCTSNCPEITYYIIPGQLL